MSPGGSPWLSRPPPRRPGRHSAPARRLAVAPTRSGPTPHERGSPAALILRRRPDAADPYAADGTRADRPTRPAGAGAAYEPPDGPYPRGRPVRRPGPVRGGRSRRAAIRARPARTAAAPTTGPPTAPSRTAGGGRPRPRRHPRRPAAGPARRAAGRPGRTRTACAWTQDDPFTADDDEGDLPPWAGLTHPPGPGGRPRARPAAPSRRPSRPRRRPARRRRPGGAGWAGAGPRPPGCASPAAASTCTAARPSCWPSPWPPSSRSTRCPSTTPAADVHHHPAARRVRAPCRAPAARSARPCSASTCPARSPRSTRPGPAPATASAASPSTTSRCSGCWRSPRRPTSPAPWPPGNGSATDNAIDTFALAEQALRAPAARSPPLPAAQITPVTGLGTGGLQRRSRSSTPARRDRPGHGHGAAAQRGRHRDLPGPGVRERLRAGRRQHAAGRRAGRRAARSLASQRHRRTPPRG